MKNMISKLKKLPIIDKALYGIFIFIPFLVVLLSMFKINGASFLLISLEANLFLVLIIKYIINLLKIKPNKKEIMFLVLIALLVYVFYFISVYNRKFVYYWDFSCYYNIQINTNEAFNTSLFSGIKSFVSSTWSGEYGNLISFFPEVIFNFTNRTADAYLLSSMAVFIPYIFISLYILLKLLKLKKEKYLIPIVVATLALCPIFHAALVYGQPDLFGLCFIFLLISLTISYDFKKIKMDRLILIGIITFMLLICRRWYLYWIISYYVYYVLMLLIKNIKNKKDLIKVIKNLFIFGMCALLFFGITLFPFIKNTIINDYSSSYAYYMNGGTFEEFYYQFEHIGLLEFIMIIIGLIYGQYNKKYRLFTILNVLQFITIIVLFTRVQNMGLHHSLLLISMYVYFMMMFFMLFINMKKGIIFTLIGMIIIISNFVIGLTNYSNILFTNVKLKAPYQKDYNQIGEVASWLKSRLNEDNTAYMIAHNSMYNPDKLRNFYMPDTTVSKYLPYGSAIVAVDKFPIELFTAKYIITMDPYLKTSVDGEYQNGFMKIKDDKFKLVKTFDMGNGYSIVIYERIKKVDKKETDIYIEELEEDSRTYPKLYKNVIENYVKENNL